MIAEMYDAGSGEYTSGRMIMGERRACELGVPPRQCARDSLGRYRWYPSLLAASHSTQVSISPHKATDICSFGTVGLGFVIDFTASEIEGKNLSGRISCNTSPFCSIDITGAEQHAT